MGEQISNSDINPIVIAVVAWVSLGCGGYFMMGMKKIAIATIVWVIVGFICFYIPGVLLWLCAIFDSFKIAGKLAAGESVDSFHHELGFLSKLPMHHE